MDTVLATTGETTGLSGTALRALPLGDIMPDGWLRRQLRIQADGLSGHLDEIWPDVARSKWIGGDADGWERGPYWLDGIVPLAVLLDDPKLKGKVRFWFDTILASRHEDGWFGPARTPHEGSEEPARDPWPIFVLFKAMTQWQEATGDVRIVPAMLRGMRGIQVALGDRPLENWGKTRASDLAVSIFWLYERTGESWLLDLARTAEAQGYDWRTHFADFKFKGKQTEWLQENHVVNHAMAIKEPAIRHRLNPTAEDWLSARRPIAVMDEHHGQAAGVFSGDESLAGRHPSQGTELCSVVEYMYSLETLLEVFGATEFADRLETIAYNALPAAFKPDMWAHQYDQQANQVQCVVAENPIYTNNGPDANLYGLEPNFGCCTANMHQGWPKFASHLWMENPGEQVPSLAALAYAPCIVRYVADSVPVEISVRTNYPFEEQINIDVDVPDGSARFNLWLRIPAWTKDARVKVEDGPDEAAPARGYHILRREWSGTTTLRLTFPMPVSIRPRDNGAIVVERGPMVYSLLIGAEWTQLRGEAPHADWEVRPTTPWNYALKVDARNPENSFAFTTGSVGDMPFSPEQAPVRAVAEARRLPEWGLVQDAADAPPPSPVASSAPLESVTLIPYGCTNLRVTEFPHLAE